MKRKNNNENDNEYDSDDSDDSSFDEDSFEIKLWSKDLLSSTSGLWIIQLKTMLKKNFILQTRYWKTAFFIIFVAPLAAMLLLKFIVFLFKSVTESTLHQSKYVLDGIDNCYGPANSPNACINFMFTNCIDDNVCNRDPVIDEIMTNFVEANNKRMNFTWETDSNKWENWENDKLKIEVKERHNIIHVPNGRFIYDYVAEHQNSTNYGLIFDIKNSGGTTNYRYQVLYNSTAHYNNSDTYDNKIASLARGLDEAIIKYANGNPNTNTKFNIELKDFPVIGYDGYDEFAMSIYAPTVYFCISMVIFINILSTIVSEKETKVRYNMEMMGLKRSVYWTSWAIVYLIYYILNTIFIIILGKLFGYSFFLKTEFMVTFVVFFFFGIAMGSMAMFITTLVGRTKTAVLIGISILIMGFIINYIFGGKEMSYVLWNNETNPIYRKIFSYLLPFINFTKAFVDINDKAGINYNMATSNVIEGEEYKWTDLTKKPDIKMFNIDDGNKYDQMEPTSYAIYYLILNTVIYFILTLYCDNILPNKYGNKKSLIYFLLPSYWRSKNSYIDDKRWISSTQRRYPRKFNIKRFDEDVREHYKYTCNPKLNKDPIKIINLKRVFGRGNKRKVAVKNLCLSIKKDMVLALLGQNGAGKSTTMNIMSGLSPPSAGDILIFNKSVRKNPEAVQSELGICPQEDILFKDLTALEHLMLYSGLKGAEYSKELEDLLNNRLKAVQLYTVRNARAKTYSGGMKRRLSMIISTIGDPKVILLDEPTTGMDPLNRRYVWRFIEEFKKDKCVIITTHSMEEADALGDKIIIMSNGVIKAMGDSNHLKNKFGNGYHISAIVDPKHIDAFKAIANQMVPGIHLTDDSAGALIYELSYDQTNYIPKFVKYLDENPDNYVNSWGMSQTTLEEVFLNVIHDSSNRKFKEE